MFFFSTVITEKMCNNYKLAVLELSNILRAIQNV